MIAARPATRRGFTLIEMILVIGSVSVILAICGSLLHVLLRLDRSGRESLGDSVTLTRLARQFRQDVRAARAVDLGKEQQLELARSDGPPIIYHLDKGLLLREERKGDDVRRREAYSLTRLGPLRFESDGSWIRLILSRHPAHPAATVRPAVIIEARLDKDRAMTNRAEVGK